MPLSVFLVVVVLARMELRVSFVKLVSSRLMTAATVFLVLLDTSLVMERALALPVLLDHRL